MPFLLEGIVFGSCTIAHSNTVNGRSETGVDRRCIFTADMKIESALGLRDNSAIILASGSEIWMRDILFMAVDTS